MIGSIPARRLKKSRNQGVRTLDSDAAGNLIKTTDCNKWFQNT
jgi:hypothetical protein